MCPATENTIVTCTWGAEAPKYLSSVRGLRKNTPLNLIMCHLKMIREENSCDNVRVILPLRVRGRLLIL